MTFLAAFLIVEALCVIGVTADYYLKVSGDGVNYIAYKPFFIGLLLQFVTAIGWFFAFKFMKVIQLGVIYSVSNILLLTLLGVLVFKEQLTPRELLGVTFAIGSVFLMARVN